MIDEESNRNPGLSLNDKKKIRLKKKSYFGNKSAGLGIGISLGRSGRGHIRPGLSENVLFSETSYDRS